MESERDKEQWPKEVQEAYDTLEVPNIYEVLLSYEKLSSEMRLQNKEVKHLHKSVSEIKHQLDCIEESLMGEDPSENESRPLEISDVEETLITLVDALLHWVGGVESASKQIDASIPRKFGLFRKTPEWRQQAAALIDSLTEGKELLCKKIQTRLDQLGITMLEPQQGDPFLPQYHKALDVCKGGKSGTVAKLLRPGFQLQDKILRYAEVSIYE